MTRRRVLLAALCIVPALTATHNAASAGGSAETDILIVGDSLSAEYGLKRGSGWVSIVTQKLDRSQSAYQVHNASISGDTTSGGLARLPAALQRTRPDIVLIELGSNDALRGLSLETARENLAKMIEMSHDAGARVLLIGMQIPPNYGRQYATQFQDLYTSLAREYNIELVPFLLEGIAADMSQFQADGIHPNEGAQAIIAENVWAALGPMLRHGDHPKPAR